MGPDEGRLKGLPGAQLACNARLLTLTSDLPHRDHIANLYFLDRLQSSRRAIKPSTRALAISTRTGVCETSKRFPRWRNPLVSPLRLSPKCPQTI